MTSDAKLTVHQMFAAYAKRYAVKHQVSTKSVIENLINDHLVEDILGLGPASNDWVSHHKAANSLLPPDWRFELNVLGAPPALRMPVHVLHIGHIGPIYRLCCTNRLIAEVPLSLDRLIPRSL